MSIIGGARYLPVTSETLNNVDNPVAKVFVSILEVQPVYTTVQLQLFVSRQPNGFQCFRGTDAEGGKVRIPGQYLRSTHQNSLTGSKGLIWAGFAVATICCGLRGLARVRTFKKLLVDDYFVLLALSLVLASAITWQVFADDLYQIMRVSAGLEMPGEDFARVSGRYFKATLAVIILFYTALWSIKISFLLFFRRLGNNVRGQRRIWWPVLGVTLATYFACIGSIQYRCLVSSFEYLAANCGTPAATSFQQITLKLNCAWDVITDCLSRFIARLQVQVLTNGSHAHTIQYAQGGADEMAPEGGARRYFFSRGYHHGSGHRSHISGGFEQPDSAG